MFLVSIKNTAKIKTMPLVTPLSANHNKETKELT